MASSCPPNRSSSLMKSETMNTTLMRLSVFKRWRMAGSSAVRPGPGDSAQPRRHIPVDPPHVVSLPVWLVLVEVEPRPTLWTGVRADPQVADALRGVHLDVAQLPHDVLGDHGIGTARSSSPRI